MTVTEPVRSQASKAGHIRIAALERQVAQLERALQSRVVIEQAKGVLSERHRLPPLEAFELLRRSARNQRRNIHQVAYEIVASACQNGFGGG